LNRVTPEELARVLVEPRKLDPSATPEPPRTGLLGELSAVALRSAAEDEEEAPAEEPAAEEAPEPAR